MHHSISSPGVTAAPALLLQCFRRTEQPLKPLLRDAALLCVCVPNRSGWIHVWSAFLQAFARAVVRCFFPHLGRASFRNRCHDFCLAPALLSGCKTFARCICPKVWLERSPTDFHEDNDCCANGSSDLCPPPVCREACHLVPDVSPNFCYIPFFAPETVHNNSTHNRSCSFMARWLGPKSVPPFHSSIG